MGNGDERCQSSSALTMEGLWGGGVWVPGHPEGETERQKEPGGQHPARGCQAGTVYSWRVTTSEMAGRSLDMGSPTLCILSLSTMVLKALVYLAGPVEQRGCYTL
jgi:hypothetical protein